MVGAHLVGVAEKGPFRYGTSVKLIELDSTQHLADSKRTHKTCILNGDGNYNFDSVDFVSPYLRVKANGYFRNELTGGLSSKPVTLEAVVDVTEKDSVNVNMLTHMEAPRVLKLVAMSDYEDRDVETLSGGQQQRIAIARALATNPRVLLCDEATSALDPSTTAQILSLIRDINAKLGITVVVITHQMSVVKEICRHVAILDRGTVAEEGLVSAVFAAPRSQAGRRLVFPGRVDEKVIDPARREKMPVICVDGQAAAVFRVGTDQRFTPGKNEKQVIITWKKRT